MIVVVSVVVVAVAVVAVVVVVVVVVVVLVLVLVIVIVVVVVVVGVSSSVLASARRVDCSSDKGALFGTLCHVPFVIQVLVSNFALPNSGTAETKGILKRTYSRE